MCKASFTRMKTQLRMSRLLLVLAFGPLTAAAQSLPLADCKLESSDRTLILEAQCARLSVAENRQDSDGKEIELFFAQLPARSREPAADPVVYLAGGPGQSASESFHLIYPVLQLLNRRRPLWVLDQRGTGRSAPLRCEQPVEEWITLSDEVAVRAAADCRATLEAKGYDLRWYGTPEAVEDLEQLRLAMGAPQLNLIAGSYGTRVAQEYMRRYPHAVRSAVLDGLVPPGLALGRDHARNLERVLDLVAAHCAERRDCRQRFGDLRSTLAALREQLQLKQQTASVPAPRTGAITQLPIDTDTLAAVVRLFSYGRDSVSLLPLIIDEAADGRPEMLASQAAMLLEAMIDGIYHGMQLSVSCSEDIPRLQPDPDDRLRLMGDALTHFMKLQCAQWPAKPVAPDFAEPLQVAVPTLLLSGEWDPVTPPAYGETVAEQLPISRHLVVPGHGHIVMRVGCMPDLVDDFVELRAAQGLDAECLQKLGPPAFFLSTTGTAP